MPLFHYSEDPSIERFVPKAPKHHPDAEPMVWAIDEWHSPLYYFPSDCPRVCFWPLSATSKEDIKRFWLDDSLRMVIAIEAHRLEELQKTTIYRYTFNEDTFTDCRDHGVFVSDQVVTPIKVEPLKPLSEELAEAGVELRLCPTLSPIATSIIATSLHWSLIRMKFAKGWDRVPGTPTMPKGKTG
jgi:hypothetical protein